MKQDLLAQAEANDVPAALASLEVLRARLAADDPFLKDAQVEIAQAYLDLAENADREGAWTMPAISRCAPRSSARIPRA